MLLTLTLDRPADASYPASDLGFLLHKHPDRAQSFDLPVGRATVFYPEAGDDRCTAALVLEVDPVALVRGRKGPATLGQYVNDRPYAASSLLAVALGRVFGTALSGRCDGRAELAASALPLTIHVPACPARRGGADLVRRLFEPLGWHVDAREVPLGDDWGQAPYVDLRLTGTLRLADALAHLYVLLPVLDASKHYWVTPDEVDKLVRRGEGWLSAHPERELIVGRYLAQQRSYIADADARLTLDDDSPDAEPATAASDDADDTDETETAERTPLRRQRLDAVLAVLREVYAHRVVDLGCGSGYYLKAMLADSAFTEIVGVDVSPRELAWAEDRLGLDRMGERQRARITLRQSSATYRDDALAGFDAVLLVEVVEHLDADRLDSLERSVFGAARPAHVVVTTPNVEYNTLYGMLPGTLRHPDHRFEWTRAEFATWARAVAAASGYRVEFRGVGEPDPELGTPTQMALFTREDS